MKQQQQIAFKIAAIVLLLAVLMPSAVKFTHIFENHKHEVCTDYSTKHMHEINLECEFFKFKVNPVFSINFETVTFLKPYKKQTLITSQYQFVSDYQKLGFALRGPPKLV